VGRVRRVSIHALRVERDEVKQLLWAACAAFQSTRSVWSATAGQLNTPFAKYMQSGIREPLRPLHL